MRERTIAYLRGRFRDHYRRTSVQPPPEAEQREWGFIPWTEGPDTTMVRHRSLHDLGDLGDFLARRGPQHVYYSAGRYHQPDADSMEAKGWKSADLVFDLDADHLPGVDPGETTYREMLEACKGALLRLLDFLEDDFAFEDIDVAFSGGRGYHVHVRDESVRTLDREHRREIVDYVRGIGLDLDELIVTETVAGLGRSTPTERRTLETGGGWGRRIHESFMTYLDELLAVEKSEAIDRLTAYEGIGEGRAEAVLTAAQENRSELEAGNLTVHTAVYQFAKRYAMAVRREQNAPIDEPVTTDTNRLIRLPGSLHGGSALSTRQIDRTAIDAFDPLVDAVPETFRGHEVTVDVSRGGEVDLGGDIFTVGEGEHTLPEFVAMFLMARGRAEKEKE